MNQEVESLKNLAELNRQGWSLEKKLRKNRETKVEQLRLALSRAICPSCGGYGNDPLKVIDSYEGTEYMCTDPYKIHVAFK